MNIAVKVPSNQTIEDINELISILTRKNKTVRPPSFLWSRVSDEVHRKLLYMVAEELNLSNPRFIASKYLEKHKFKFLNNTALNGLYSYYKNRFPRKPGVHIITNVCDKLGIPQVTVDDWIHFISQNNIFSWKNVPCEVKKEILLRACKELGYPHPIFIKNDDFSVRFKFLNGKTLTGFYTYFKNLSGKDIRGSVIKNMCRMLNIEIKESDWVSYIINHSTTVFWDIIPPEVVRNLLFKAAEKLGYTNPRMMSTDDLKVKMDFLDGMSLYSFVSRFFGVDRGGSQSIDYICDKYGIPDLTFEEWIELISHHKNFKWERVPEKYIGKILLMKAAEEKKDNPRMLKYEDLAKPCGFLNNKNLVSLYTYYSGIANKSEIDTINFMCDRTGIPPLTTSQWISVIGEVNSKVSWEIIPSKVKKEILKKAAEELGLKNPRLMGYKDLCATKFKFLNGKTLSGLYANYILKMPDKYTNAVQYICDMLGIEKLKINEWIDAIANSTMCRWESVPLKVQKEIVIRAAAEMGLPHPRMMGTKEFDSVQLKFLNNKTLCGLYYHYAAKLSENNNQQITEYIFNVLNIPKMDIHPTTGRLTTIDNTSHRKYFDSFANFKAFVNRYLQLFDLQSLCRKYSTINNAKKAGIYIRGLVTILAPMNKKEYIDFIFETLKSVPRDRLGLRKPRKGDYRLRKSDLYAIAGIKETEEKEKNKINFAQPSKVKIKDQEEVIKELKVYKDILDIKIKKFHEVKCDYLVTFGDSVIFNVPVSFFPGDILTSNTGHEFEVSDCRERKTNNGYVIELKPLSPISEKKASMIKTLSKDSNDSILSSYLEGLINDIKNDSLSPLLAVTLGLKKEDQLSEEDVKQLPPEAYFNKLLLTNPAQKQAVALASILDGTNNVLEIVQGPPGTGKTTLIEEIALQYYHAGKNVLILAKTNVAVDNVLEKLIKHRVRVLRTGNNIRRKSTLPYAYTVSTSNPVYMAKLGNKNKIVLGTPLGFYLDRNIEAEEYDLVIIDEASQMDVPETLFSLGFGKNCVMIGDHLQIPPFPIQEEVLLEYNPKIDLYTREELQKSLFEKLITDKNRFNSVFLDINYRTENPEMVSLISDLVYDGRLYPNVDSTYYKVPKSKRKKLFPEDSIEIIDTSEFIDVQARAETEVNSTYYNLCEAMMSVKKVMDLLKKGEKLEDICIITPYKAHAEKVKEVFLEHFRYFTANHNDLLRFIEQNIYTVDSFQGKEQQNIIINWVRSNYSAPGSPTKTGFLRDFRRINVALSRAKKRLILIGDFETLTKSDNLKVRYIFTKLKNFKKEEKIVL